MKNVLDSVIFGVNEWIPLELSFVKIQPMNAKILQSTKHTSFKFYNYSTYSSDAENEKNNE